MLSQLTPVATLVSTFVHI